MVTVLPPEMNKFQAIMHQLQKGFGQTLPNAYERDQSLNEKSQANKYLQMQQDLQRQTNQGVISDLEQRRGLPAGSLSAYAADPKMAEQISRPQNPQGGVSAQSVPPQVSQMIREVLNQNPQASSDELRAAMDEAGIPPTFSNPYTENRRRKEEINAKSLGEKEKATRKEETAISQPVLLEMNEVRKNIPLQEQAIQDIQDAAANVSPLDYFADVTGFEPLRSASGAKLKTGIKDFFLSDLTRAGARPNQWIEQQLLDALPKIGRSKEANLITAEGMKFKVDLAKKRLEEIDRLSEEDREKYGFVRANIDSRATQNMKKYVEQRQKELKSSIERIKKDKNDGKVASGTKLTPDIAMKYLQNSGGDRKKAEEMAKEDGYEF